MRRNRISIDQKNKRTLSISRTYEVNINLVYIYVGISHEELGQHNDIRFLLAPQNRTVDLTATSNSKLFQMDTNDEKDKNYQLITTDDETMMKPNIPLIQLNNHLLLHHKLRQLYYHLFPQYL